MFIAVHLKVEMTAVISKGGSFLDKGGGDSFIIYNEFKLELHRTSIKFLYTKRSIPIHSYNHFCPLAPFRKAI